MIHDDIRTILSAPTAGEDAPTLPRVEDTLTAGYARALSLEADHRRFQRRLADSAAALAGDDSRRRVNELRRLAHKLKAVDAELAELRALLSSLSERAALLRAA
jgi:paraquat-inducible protein B